MSHSPFRGSIPADRLYHPAHDMWVLPDDDGKTLLIGATEYGIHRAGKVIRFTNKANGSRIETGHDMASLACVNTVITMYAPVGFELIEGNQALAENPELLNRDPYDTGWMARARPHDWLREMGQLMDGKHYRRHVRRADPNAEFL